jgi:hypothetical protein
MREKNPLANRRDGFMNVLVVSPRSIAITPIWGAIAQ